jgi:B12-binding domain/radical SAM domain protein
MMRDMRLFGTDLVLLHPPSVYDFRRTRAEYGPISDVIFSSPAFEMYPIGLTSLASHLEEGGHNVRLVNVAYRMLSDPDYDAEAALAKLDPAMFGIDLHWLPHAHGALELAKIVKRYHPATPVVMGGLSASYFHEELIRLPFVDYVLRGDSTEEPLLGLMRAVLWRRGLDQVPNLTWKHTDGSIVVNPLSSVPTAMEGESVPDVFYAVKAVFKYRSLADVVPFKGWLQYPITGLLTARGCSMGCAACGGSRQAYNQVCGRTRPAFRAPEMLAKEMRKIERLSRGPIFLIHDLRQSGPEYAQRLFDSFATRPPKNEIILELFFPAVDDYLARVGAAFPRWSLQITLESHLRHIRHRNRRFDCPQEEIDLTVSRALEHGAGRVDLFFIVGLPGQTYEDAVTCVDYCRSLLERFKGDKRLCFFVAPLGPFLDPGSSAYEHPAEFGYRVRFRTLEEHRAALTSPSWKEMLNYETDCMTRDQIVSATYEAMRRLARLRHEWGFSDTEGFEAAMRKIDTSEAAVDAIHTACQLPAGEQRDAALAEAYRNGHANELVSRFQKNELVWSMPKGRRFGSPISLAGIGLGLAAHEARLFFTQRLPMYRKAPTSLD